MIGPLAKCFTPSVNSNLFCLGFGNIESSLCCVSCSLRPGVLLVFLHCRYRTLIWVVEQHRVVCFYTVPHSSFEVRSCVRHTQRSDVYEFSPLVPGNMLCRCRVSTSIHRFGVRIALRFTDDEWSVSQIKFNIQLLSCLINSNSETRFNNRRLLTS